jgi:putative hydrolase of the HAD superfamily
MIELISSLKAHYGLKAAVVSNEGLELNKYRIRKFSLGRFIDFSISSSFVHFRTPDADVFRIALDIAQVEPAQVVYIEDRSMFVEVARSQGIKDIVHTGHDATQRELAEFGLMLPE